MSRVPAAAWSAAIEAHARRAARIYAPEKLEAVARVAGLSIAPDGSNGAASRDDVQAYLRAVERVLGAMAVASARMAILNRLRELGLTKL